MKKIFLKAVLLGLFMVSPALSQNPASPPAEEELNRVSAEVVKFFRQKDYNSALPPARNAVRLSEQVFGKDHLETALALLNLGLVQYSRDEAKAAGDAFERAAAIYKKAPDLDKQHGARYADALEWLATIRRADRHLSAEGLFERALEWREKTAGADSFKTAKSLYHLSTINYWNRAYKKASTQLERLLDVYSKNPQAAGEDAALIFYRAECAFGKAGRQEDFEKIRNKYSSELNIEHEPKDNSGDPKGLQVIGSGTVNGKAYRLVKPDYPQEAKNAMARGDIRVRVLIDKTGSVIQACGDREGHPALVEVSEIAAYRSQFTPTIVKGKPVSVFGTIVYRFGGQ